MQVQSSRGQRVILPLHPLAESDPARSTRVELHGLHTQVIVGEAIHLGARHLPQRDETSLPWHDGPVARKDGVNRDLDLSAFRQVFGVLSSHPHK
eukprot:3742463-Pyramimonas_sp.AAC.1